MAPALDLVEEGDQITHTDLSLDEDYADEDLDEASNLFHNDPEYDENEKRYDAIRKEILGDPNASSDDECTLILLHSLLPRHAVSFLFFIISLFFAVFSPFVVSLSVC